MTNANTRTFIEIRDAYFLNPGDPTDHAKRLADAAGTIIEGLAGRNADPGAVFDPLSPAAGLASEYVHGSTDPNMPAKPARHFDHLQVAQLHPSDFEPGILAGLASIIANNNTIISQVSPLEAVYEERAVDWLMKNIAGFDADKGSGLLVTGGTSANNHALAVARLKLESQRYAGFKHETLGSKMLSWTGIVGKTYKVKQAVLFSTDMAHYSLQKGAGLIAPTDIVKIEKVPLERGGYKMDPKQLEKHIKRARRRSVPILGVVAVAGETETGVVDDIETIGNIAEKHYVHFHVDAAYGGPYRLSSAGDRLKGIEKAHSVTIDPHKYMYTPYSAGAILFRRARDHARIGSWNEDGASYMFQGANSARAQAHQFTRKPYLGDRRLEGSMGGQAAAMTYTTIRTLGRDGLSVLLDHNIEMTNLFVEEMSDFADLAPHDGQKKSDIPGLTPAHEVELNSICFRPNVKHWKMTKKRIKELGEKLEATSQALEDNHGIYLSTTELPCQNRFLRKLGRKEKVLRVVFTHPYTGEEEVRQIAAAVKQEWEGANDKSTTTDGGTES